MHATYKLAIFITKAVMSVSTINMLQHVAIKHLFCSLAVLDPRVSHIMDVLSPFIKNINM